MSEKAAPPASTEGGAIPDWDTADRMRKALRHAGLGVAEMATYLEVSRTSVSNWINGRVQPSGQTLRLWALRCGVPYAWLRGNGPRAFRGDRFKMTCSWTPRAFRGNFHVPAHLAAA